MSDPGRPITEEELHAYVDGQLEPDRREAVERYLRENPEEAARAADFRMQRDALRAAFAEGESEPLPQSLNFSRLVEARLSRRRGQWRIAAGLLLALGLGGAAGWFAGSRPPAGLHALAQEARINYAVYATDKRRPVELWAAQRDDLARWLSNRLNRPVSPPDLTASGYHLLGGRLAAAARGPAALFVYENESGRRLVLYVRPMRSPENTPITEVDIGDVDGCAWTDRGVGYTLVAAEPYARLLALSQAARRQAQSAG